MYPLGCSADESGLSKDVTGEAFENKYSSSPLNTCLFELWHFAKPGTALGRQQWENILHEGSAECHPEGTVLCRPDVVGNPGQT